MKKKKLFLGLTLAAIGAASIFAFAACGEDPVTPNPNPGGDDNPNPPPAHTHTLTAHEEQEATCSAAGVEAYWQCSGCNKYFSDAAGTTEITAPVAIPKTEHSYTVNKYDETYHWEQCEWCDETTEKATHASAGEMVVVLGNPPTKTNYFVGETFSSAGLQVVKECYDECGYSEDVTADVTLQNAPAELTEEGSVTVDVIYNDKKVTSFTVSVEAVKVDSITVELKDGVTYFNNGLAIPKASDFTVTANYNNNTTGVLEETEYTVTAVEGFSSNGGKITISVVGVNVSYEIENYELVAVSLEKIEITTQPNNTTFKPNEAISLEGMVITATYNDGTATEVTEYTTDAQETYTEEGEKTVTITYDGKTVTLTINISNSDGQIESLTFADGASYSVYAGSAFNEADVPAVYAVYTSGRKVQLESGDYSLQTPSGNAVMGTKYEVTAKLTADETKTVTLPVKVLTKLNGDEYSDMAGGSKNSSKSSPEKEYVVAEDGTITASDRVVPYVGGFSKVAEAGGDAHVTWTVASSSSAAADITFRAANSYLKNTADGYIMDALQVNSVADIYVNGEKLDIPDSVVLAGCGPNSGYAPLYNIYLTFTIDGLTLAKGDNRIMLVWKNSTLGQKNHWNETPSTMNIDYIEVATYGVEGDGTAADATVQSLNVYQNPFSFDYGDDVAAVTTYINKIKAHAISAVMSDGSRKLLTAEEYDVTVTGGDTSKGWIGEGTYTVTVALKSDTEIKDSWTVEVVKVPHALEAYGATLKVEDNKVYFGLILTYVGEDEYTAADFEVYDGATVLAVSSVEQRATQVIVYMDVTDRDASGFYTHLKVKGTPYDNGEGKTNGDFKETSQGGKIVSTLVYPNKSVTNGGKTYSLGTQWNMAVLTIANA